MYTRGSLVHGVTFEVRSNNKNNNNSICRAIPSRIAIISLNKVAFVLPQSRDRIADTITSVLPLLRDHIAEKLQVRCHYFVVPILG